MRKNHFLLVLALPLISLFCTGCSDSEDGDPDYFTSRTLTWMDEEGSPMYFVKNSDGTLAVSYNPKHPRLLTDDYKATLTDYVGDVVVPQTVTIDGVNYVVSAVSEGAFANETTLKTLTLPTDIYSFGGGAFVNCKALTSVNIPDGVTVIPNACFGNCSKLTALTIPDGVTTIGDAAFYGASGIKTLTLPAQVKSIGHSAFYKCSKMTELHIKAMVPPAAVDTLTDNNNMVLYVPTGAKSAYESNEMWNKFKDIIEED